jgi:hypothetical protein
MNEFTAESMEKGMRPEFQRKLDELTRIVKKRGDIDPEKFKIGVDNLEEMNATIHLEGLLCEETYKLEEQIKRYKKAKENLDASVAQYLKKKFEEGAKGYDIVPLVIPVELLKVIRELGYNRQQFIIEAIREKLRNLGYRSSKTS